MKKRRKIQPDQNSQALSSNLVAVHLGGCLSPEQIAASVTGELNQIDQDTVMAHLAACADCSAQYNLLLGPNAQQPTLFSHGRWRWWLLAAGIVAAAPLLLLSGKDKTPTPQPKPLTVAPAIAPPSAPAIAPPSAPAIAPPSAPAIAPRPATPTVAPLSTPAVKAPAVKAPAVKAPAVKAPAVKAPAVKAPAVKAPAVKVPAAAPAIITPAKPTVAKVAQPPAEPKKIAAPPPVHNSKLLMTAAEAALPASTQTGLAGISVDDGPTIVIDQPRDGATVGSGFALHILYDASGSETIDLNTVKLVCRKQPPINLTPRIRSHITQKGIWLDSVQLPPGKYRLRLSLADTQGRPAEREFSLTVVP